MAFQTISHTCNPVHVHAFSWTIENVSRITEPLTGPSFSPIPNCSDVFRFDLSIDYTFVSDYPLKLFLYIQAKDRTFNFSCDVSLCDGNDKIMTCDKIQLKKLVKNASWGNKVLFTYLKKTTEESEFFDLPDDKLIVKARFSLSGYDTNSDISSSKVTPSRVRHEELSKDLKTMFESGFAHDVTFSVGEKTIPAHRAIVCSRSPVFAKMLEHDMLGKKSNNIVIKDADFAVFNYFMIFLYTGSLGKSKKRIGK